MKVQDIEIGRTYEGRKRGLTDRARQWRRGRPFPLRGAGRKAQDTAPRTVVGFFADPGGPREPVAITGDDVLAAGRMPGVSVLVEYEAEGRKVRAPIDAFARWAQRAQPEHGR